MKSAIAISILDDFCTEYQKIKKSDYFKMKDVKHSSYMIMSLNKEIQLRAEIHIKNCEKEINENNKEQIELMNRRAELYEKIENSKNTMSSLEVEILKATNEIHSLESEITQDKFEIENLQREIRKKNEERKYWENVWWATCWIPFANIGTGIKAIEENDEYSIRAEQIRRNIVQNEERISMLNSELSNVRRKQMEEKESSSALANQITGYEGQIASFTEQINFFKSEMTICRKILEVCTEIRIIIDYDVSEFSIISDEIEKLKKIKDEIESVDTTDKFIAGCICRGDRICLGERLNQNEYVLSENRRFVAVMQSDNNFVVYNSNEPIWDSKTYGAVGMGNISINGEGVAALNNTNKSWNTKRGGADYLIMQNDGNLVAYTKEHTPVWASDTYTYANVPSICFRKFSK